MLLLTFPQTWNSLIYACVSILTMRKNVKRRNHARTRSRRVFCCWVLFTFAMIMKIPCIFFSWRNYVCNWLWLLQAQGFQSQDWYGRFASLSHQPGTYWSVFVDRIREMVSFELGKEIEKYVFRPVMSVRHRKNSECPGGFEPQTCGFCALMRYHWATRLFFLCPTLVTRRKTSLSDQYCWWWGIFPVNVFISKLT